jgi:hypothetical protein
VIEKAQTANLLALDPLRWADEIYQGWRAKGVSGATQNQASAIGAGAQAAADVSHDEFTRSSAADWPSWHPQPTRLSSKGERGPSAHPAAYPPSDRLPASPSITHRAATGSRPTSGVPIRWLALPFLPVRDKLPGGALGCRSLKQLSDQLGGEARSANGLRMACSLSDSTSRLAPLARFRIGGILRLRRRVCSPAHDVAPLEKRSGARHFVSLHPHAA